MTALRQLGSRRRAWRRDDLAVDAVAAAQTLLGSVLVVVEPDDTELAVRVVETEAYRESDPASHSSRGPTARTRVMFGPPGHAYVYFTYGMHHCLNVVCEPDGVGAAVLLRAAVPLTAVDRIRGRRGARPDRELLAGPGRLTAGLGIDRRNDGQDLLGDGPIRLEDDGWRPAADAIATGPRVGVRTAADVPWRFHVAGVAEVSRYVRHPRAPAS